MPDYESVPPKRTFTVPTRYVFRGKGKPLPFDLPERDDLPDDVWDNERYLWNLGYMD